ncbi:hypothetical protein TNCV_4505621 [Trichonephila clavipes]|nr:hypothetical protein TNCV_4505621 [Trichonephila clavipes]
MKHFLRRNDWESPSARDEKTRRSDEFSNYYARRVVKIGARTLRLLRRQFDYHGHRNGVSESSGVDLGSSTNTNHAKAMLSATIAVFFTVAPAWRNPYVGRARFELRTGVTINEETTPENNKQKKLFVFL